MVFDPQLLAEIFECFVIKLLSTIGDNDFRDPKATDDAFQTKFQTFFSVTVAKGSTSTHLIK